MSLLRNILSRFDRFDITNAAGSVFMRRYKLLKTRWGNVYLHEILRSDEDNCLHDHPWSFVTLILAGGYREQMPHGTFWRRPGALLVRPATTAHRVEVDRPAWSLVCVSPKWRPWGFFTVHGWRQFFAGQMRPICEDGSPPPSRRGRGSGGEGRDGVTITEPKSRAARKQHACFWCGEAIPAGSTYTTWTCFDAGRANAVRVHPECGKAWQREASRPTAHEYREGIGEAEHCRGCACERGNCECLASVKEQPR